MIAAVAAVVVRLAVCVLLSWAVWRWQGLTSMVTTLPIFGVVLARPLIDLAAAVRQQMRQTQWRDVEGRHFEFRGRPVRVIEDDARRRWVRLADVRAIVGFTASDGALALSYPQSVLPLGRAGEPHLRDEALLAHLQKERSAEALRLSRWVEREIVFPARRARERHAGGARPSLPPTSK
jgi:hypothetical protein